MLLWVSTGGAAAVESWIDTLSPVDLSATGALIIVFLLVVMGKLVPRSVLRDQQDETAHWRRAHSLSEIGRHKVIDQNSELIEIAREQTRQGTMSVSALKAVREVAASQEDDS